MNGLTTLVRFELRFSVFYSAVSPPRKGFLRDRFLDFPVENLEIYPLKSTPRAAEGSEELSV
ncbi:MAG: hypothetical protein AB8G22_15425 [Saprospiraceae bacterium]